MLRAVETWLRLTSHGFYFLPSPWTHFLALGLGQWKKQQPREGETERKGRERGWREEERGGGKKQQLDSGIKTGANPRCIVQHYPLPLLSLTLPSGLYGETFRRQWLLFVRLCSH